MATRILRFFQPFPSSYGLDEAMQKNVPKNNSFAEFRISDAKQNQIVFARGVSPKGTSVGRTWAKTLLSLQTCELFTFSEQGMRCSRLQIFQKIPLDFLEY